MTETEYWREVQFLSIEVEDVIAIFQTYEQIHSLALADRAVFDAFNRDALFWKIHVYSLQTSLFIILGRILDEASDAHSIHNLLNATLSHIEFFSQEALSSRRMSGGLKPEWLDDFIASAWFPKGATDLRHLKKGLGPYAKTFKTIYRPIRHSVFAHKLESDDEQVLSLFAPTNRAEVGAFLDFLFDLMSVIEHLYLNGRKPELGIQSESIHRHNRRIRDNVKAFIYKVTEFSRGEDRQV
jgi:hypothetical protein